MNRTKIEYADYTWNLWTGCYHQCPYCYARRIAERFRSKDGEQHAVMVNYVPDMPIYYAGPDSPPFPMGFAPTYYPKREPEPLKLRKDGQRIFVGDMADVFGRWVPIGWLVRLFAIMAACREQTFLLLTKAPAIAHEVLSHPAFLAEVEYAADEFTHAYDGDWPLPNVFLGVTAEDQARADERIPLLLETPAAVRFVSIEPMLGPVDLPVLLHHRGIEPSYGHVIGTGDGGEPWIVDHRDGAHWSYYDLPFTGVDWVIAGGETGPGARPLHPAWVRQARDQCQAAGVPLFVKQLGEWAPIGHYDEHGQLLSYSLTRDRTGKPACAVTPDGRMVGIDFAPTGSAYMERVGKARAGHLLDGVEHRAFPRAGCDV